MQHKTPIGVFDSGYGGLTVLKEMVALLPQYDFIYLGDNARAPYGTRSFESVYQYTLESVQWLFEKNCHLVVLACNTASAKALRSIQQIDLQKMGNEKRVLGVIRPTTELIGSYSKSNHIGILATSGTVSSQSYPIEIGKFFPKAKVFQQACPMLVPLVENNELRNSGCDFFVKKYVDQLLQQSSDIDTILLGCTHFPLLYDKIREYCPPSIQIISQGEIVANSLADYLHRHTRIESRLSQNSEREFYTTDSALEFDQHASLFYGKDIAAKHTQLKNS